jgi:hypothetical protein
LLPEMFGDLITLETDLKEDLCLDSLGYHHLAEELAATYPDSILKYSEQLVELLEDCPDMKCVYNILILNKFFL